MKKIKKQPSVVPVYLVALLWAVGGFGFRIHTPMQILLFVVLSVVILVVGGLIFKGHAVEQVQHEEPEEEYEPEVSQPEEEPEEEPERHSSEHPEILALRDERDRAIHEMRQLNDCIGDLVISRQIDRIESTTDKIFDCVSDEPEKAAQVRRFMNYYLPTTLKLLNTYDRLSGSAASNVDGAKKKISDLMNTIVRSFDHQLSALYRGETLDINGEIQVLYRVLNDDGRADKNVTMSSRGTRK